MLSEMPVAPAVTPRPIGRVSAILPTLNEVENIVPLIDGLYEAVPDIHEVIVVDDDSPDGTAELAQHLAEQHPERRVRVERRLTDHGLSKSLAHGANVATGEIVVWMDCDLSMPPKDVPRLLAGLAQGHDIAVGSRFVPGGSEKRNTAGTRDNALAVLLSNTMNALLRLLFGRHFKDYTSGFIAIPRAIVLELGLRGDYGEYFVDLIVRAMRAGYDVVEVPYVCVPRQRGVSKTGIGLVSHGLKYLATTFALWWEGLRRPSR